MTTKKAGDEMRTAKEIRGMIALLRLQRAAIPRHSAFGDDNHARIDTEISCLESAVKADAGMVESLREGEYEAYDDTKLRIYDWVLNESDEAPVEADDIWVKKARDSR